MNINGFRLPSEKRSKVSIFNKLLIRILPLVNLEFAAESLHLIIEEITFLAIESSTYGITCRLVQQTLLAFASLTKDT